jgi:hypothetical protein
MSQSLYLVDLKPLSSKLSYHNEKSNLIEAIRQFDRIKTAHSIDELYESLKELEEAAVEDPVSNEYEDETNNLKSSTVNKRSFHLKGFFLLFTLNIPPPLLFLN